MFNGIQKYFNKVLTTTPNYYLFKLLEKLILEYIGRMNELGTIRLKSGIGDIVNLIIRVGLYRVADLLARCPQICLAVNRVEDKIGDIFTEAGGREDWDGVEWVLEAEKRGELGRWLLESGRLGGRFASCLVVEISFILQVQSKPFHSRLLQNIANVLDATRQSVNEFEIRSLQANPKY